MDIEQKIRDFILSNLYFAESSTLTNDVSFLAEGIIDSMGALELVTFVESEFGIKVEMSEVVVKNFDSIHKLANFVRRKVASSSSLPSKTLEPVSVGAHEQTLPISSEAPEADREL